jgi:hypothetical protein
MLQQVVQSGQCGPVEIHIYNQSKHFGGPCEVIQEFFAV